jgi:hypothetical protein
VYVTVTLLMRKKLYLELKLCRFQIQDKVRYVTFQYTLVIKIFIIIILNGTFNCYKILIKFRKIKPICKKKKNYLKIVMVHVANTIISLLDYHVVISNDENN